MRLSFRVDIIALFIVFVCVNAASLQPIEDAEAALLEEEAGAMSLLSLSEAHRLQDPYCDRNTPKCCDGLKCPYVGGICCTGAQFCCPSGSLCVPASFGEPTRCGIGAAPASPNSPWAKLPNDPQPPQLPQSSSSSYSGCPCAQVNPCDVRPCPCSCGVPAPPPPPVEADIDNCGENPCGKQDNDFVDPEIVEAEEVTSGGLQSALISGRDVDVPQPANTTNTTSAPVAAPVVTNITNITKQLFDKPVASVASITSNEELELAKIKNEQLVARETVASLKRLLEDSRAKQDSINGVKIDQVRTTIRVLEGSITNMNNETLVREKEDEERQKVNLIVEDRAKKDETTKEQEAKRKDIIKNEVQFKANMEKMAEEQDKAVKADADRRAREREEAQKRLQMQLQTDQEAVKQMASKTADVVAAARASAAQAVVTEQSLKTSIQDIKALSAVEKAKLDAEIENFSKTSMELAKQRVEQETKRQAEDYQKNQNLELNKTIRKLQNSDDAAAAPASNVTPPSPALASGTTNATSSAPKPSNTTNASPVPANVSPTPANASAAPANATAVKKF